MSYYADSTFCNNLLVLGDDSGCVTSLTFKQPKNGVFRKKHNDKLNVFYWAVSMTTYCSHSIYFSNLFWFKELATEKQYVTIKNHGKIHNDTVRQIKYIGENESIISCSRDSNFAVVNQHFASRRKQYVYKIHRVGKNPTINFFAISWVLGSKLLQLEQIS